MSYDIRFEDPKTGMTVEVSPHTEGGTYVVGGNPFAEINITYNYAWFYYRFLDEDQGIRWLYGKTGAETVGRLEKAVKELGTNRYKDYWAPTPGNAGHALNILLQWAKKNPDAVWRGD